mmetsp:Transcript_13314/g.38843  ORF Transcript_13314/g.38843 Transcript_13314/m.38843 type:complete len:224 (+) Transcript_13314:967-1638(+)
MGDHLHRQLVPRNAHIHEAILVVPAMDVGHGLRGYAPTAAGDDHTSLPEHSARAIVHLLQVPVARNVEVHTVTLDQRRPDVHVVVGRKVGDDDLPISRGPVKDRLQPVHLRLPESLKPAMARIHRLRPLDAATSVRRVVPLAADVVILVGTRWMCIVDIGVKEEEVDRAVGIPHRLAPELGRGKPAAAGAPGVADGVVPSGSEHPAAIVVVAQNAKPWQTTDV